MKIFFDGRCYICSKEIDVYRKRNHAGQFEFIDISHQDFKAIDYNLDEKEVNKEFHVETENGQYVKGVDAFAEVWRKLPGWQWAANLMKWTLVRTIMKCGYYLFREIRPYLPRRKKSCSEGVCSR